MEYLLELKMAATSIIVLYKIDNDNLNIMSLCQISSTNNEELSNYSTKFTTGR